MAKRRSAGSFLQQAKATGEREPIDIPGLDMEVFAVTLSRLQVKAITDACTRPGKVIGKDQDAIDNDLLEAKLIGACIVDKDGHRLIPDGAEGEIDELPNRVQIRLQSAALRVNGMGADDADARDDSGNDQS